MKKEKQSIDKSTEPQDHGTTEETFEVWEERFLRMKYGYYKELGKQIWLADSANSRRELERIAKAKEDAAEEAKITPKMFVTRVQGSHINYSYENEKHRCGMAQMSEKGLEALRQGQNSFHLCIEDPSGKKRLLLPDEVPDLEKTLGHPPFKDYPVEVGIRAF